MSTAKNASDAGEWRRKRAWELSQEGWWQKDIAAALGVSCSAVCQWIKRAREQGVEGLQRRPHPGCPPKLTAAQRAQIPALLARGAAAHGFRGDVWTAKRVVAVIERAFGVRYHPDHVTRLLRQAGWSRQRPIQRATQRDEAAIRRWQEERWPAYAPDLNPDEGVWNYLTGVELKNCCCADLAELHLEVRRAKERLRHKQHIIRSFSTHCGYSV